MIPMFAETATATDPISTAFGYYFTQGVLGVTVIVLALVIRFLFSYFTKKIDEKDAEIKALNLARFEDGRSHSSDYREMAKNDQAVLLGTAQATELLSAKIEAVRGK